MRVSNEMARCRRMRVHAYTGCTHKQMCMKHTPGSPKSHFKYGTCNYVAIVICSLRRPWRPRVASVSVVVVLLISLRTTRLTDYKQEPTNHRTPVHDPTSKAHLSAEKSDLASQQTGDVCRRPMRACLRNPASRSSQYLDTQQRGVQWIGVVLYSKIVYNII